MCINYLLKCVDAGVKYPSIKHCFRSSYLQIFRELELPAEQERIHELRTSVTEQRGRFVQAITNNSDLHNLDYLVAVELAKYEKVIFEMIASEAVRREYIFKLCWLWLLPGSTTGRTGWPGAVRRPEVPGRRGEVEHPAGGVLLVHRADDDR